jgi:heme/copper-type cytochrome/quinol oxidase subunit 1
MAVKKDLPRIIGNRLQANLVGMVVLLFLIGICVLGVIAGVEGIQRREYGDFMSPIWFVASAFGGVVLAVVFLGMAAGTAAELVESRRKKRSEDGRSTGNADKSN